MSPRVPMRLLTMILLLVASLEVLVTSVGWQRLALTALAVAGGLLLGALIHFVRETTRSLGVHAWEVGPSPAPMRAPEPLPAREAAAREVPARRAIPARKGPRWLPDALATAGRFAVLLLVASTVMVLRTALALDVLASW